MARPPDGARASKRGTKKPEPRPVGRPTKYEPRFCAMVIKAGKQGYSLGAFAGMIGVCRATLDVWIKEHPEFLGACNASKATRQLHWESSAIRVAKRGGGPGTAQVIQFALKNCGSEDWSDTTKLEAKVDAKVEHSADDAFAAFAGALERAAKGKAEGA